MTNTQAGAETTLFESLVELIGYYSNTISRTQRKVDRAERRADRAIAALCALADEAERAAPFMTYNAGYPAMTERLRAQIQIARAVAEGDC